MIKFQCYWYSILSNKKIKKIVRPANKMIRVFCSLFLSFGLLFYCIYALACTIITLSDGDFILAGNNEDYYEYATRMWFIPGSNYEYGRVCFGYVKWPGFVQGGMNEKGLFIDANGVSSTGWKYNPQKGKHTLPFTEYILATCATVDDVIKVLNEYNTPELDIGKFPFADAEGDAAIVEWGKGKQQIIKRTGRYQISTNFVQTNYDNPNDYPCDRYKTADRILNSVNEVSVDLVRSVLNATHLEGAYPTQYSNIYDLKNRVVYLYHHYNFNKVLVFNLDEELKKGYKIYDIPLLFNETKIDIIVTEGDELLQLYQNYPNPFNPGTFINFFLPKDSRVELKIFNILGEEVKTLENGVRMKGYHSINFSSKDLSSGNYIYYLKTDMGVRTKVMTYKK